MESVVSKIQETGQHAAKKTDLVFTQSGFATDESRDGHGEGWNAAIDRLVPAL